MNAVLLKYAGTVVTIGGNAAERRMYIKEKVKANRDFTRQEHDGIPWEVQTRHRGLSAIILEKILQKMWIMEASGRANPTMQDGNELHSEGHKAIEYLQTGDEESASLKTWYTKA
jgi:hypothetical protein